MSDLARRQETIRKAGEQVRDGSIWLRPATLKATPREYSRDPVWCLLDVARATVRRAHLLCDDPDTEYLDTALVLASEEAIREAQQARYRAIEGGDESERKREVS